VHVDLRTLENIMMTILTYTFPERKKKRGGGKGRKRGGKRRKERVCYNLSPNVN